MIFSPPLQEMLMPANRVRLGILASGSGSNFESIVEQAPALNINVVGLIVNVEDAGAIGRARRLGIPCEVIDHKSFGTRREFDERVAQRLKHMEAEWVAMAGWMRIVTPSLLSEFPDRIINLHPSLLPSFRGANAVPQTLKAGVKVTGCTVHMVNEEVDDGRIIAQAVVPVREGDDEKKLHARIHAVEHQIYPRAIAHAIGLAS